MSTVALDVPAGCPLPLHLHNNRRFDNEIESILAVQRYALVHERTLTFGREGELAHREFEFKTFRISGFQKARSQDPMDFDRSGDDLPCEVVGRKRGEHAACRSKPATLSDLLVFRVAKHQACRKPRTDLESEYEGFESEKPSPPPLRVLQLTTGGPEASEVTASHEARSHGDAGQVDRKCRESARRSGMLCMPTNRAPPPFLRSSCETRSLRPLRSLRRGRRRSRRVGGSGP